MLAWGATKEMKYGLLPTREESVSKFIPYTRHIRTSTIQTKENHYLKVIKLKGLPFETTESEEIEHRQNIRATLLRGIADSKFAIYHHIIRREFNPEISGEFMNPWCQSLHKAYTERLSHKRMFINEQYITVVRRVPITPFNLLTEIGRTFSDKIDKELEKARLEDSLHELDEAVSNLISTLAPYEPYLLGTEESSNGITSSAVSFLSYITNGEINNPLLPYGILANYLPSKRISFGKETFELRGVAPDDVKLGAILSIKEYADSTTPGMLDDLLRLPHEFILTQSFSFIDRQASLNRIQEIKRKLSASEEGAISLEEEMDEAIDDVSSGRSIYGEHHLTLALTSPTPSSLNRAISEANSIFINKGIIATREDMNLEAAYWAQLPGNFNYIARKSLISNKNFAALSSLHNFSIGKISNNHWGSAISLFETTSGTPYWFNFHERDVGNFTVIGPVGTGKTVLLTFLHAQAQKLSPKTVYFDKDRGAEIYLRAIGSDYTVVKRGIPTNFNPLHLEDTQENRAFLKDWLRLLLSIENESPLSPRDLDAIHAAIDATMALPVSNRRLAILAQHLRGHERDHSHSLSSRLSMWHSGGERSWLFDNEIDSLSLENPNIGFDLTSLLDDPVSRTPWLMYVFYKITEMLDGQKVMLMLDEGWKLLDDPEFAYRIKDWLKTIRKQNGIVGFATQSAKDALESSVGDSIIEQSPTQIFLPNAKATEKDYCNGFGLTKHELSIIRELPTNSHCFLLKHGHDSVIARLDLTGMDDFTSVLSGRTESVRKMTALIEQFGLEPENWLPRFYEWRATQ